MRKFEKVSTFNQRQVTLPQRQTYHSAGYDLAAMEAITIQPQSIGFVKTGLKVHLQDDEVLLVYARSSLGIKKHLMMSNGVGVIDADYYNNPSNEGHIMVPLFNFGKTEVTIEQGERVAQGIFTTYLKASDDTPKDQARDGGFGSSSK